MRTIFTTSGIEKLFQDLKPGKAPARNSIPMSPELYQHQLPNSINQSINRYSIINLEQLQCHAIKMTVYLKYLSSVKLKSALSNKSV